MVKIKLDGKEYEFKPLDINDMILLEERFGGLEKMTSKGTLTMMEARTLVWLLVRKTSEMTEEQVGEKLIPTKETFAETISSISAMVASETK